MKTSDFIIFRLNRFPKGYVFTYHDFIVDVDKKDAIIKALNRLAKTNKIARLSKGKYYKPEDSEFGSLKPSLEQSVKDLLEKEDKIIGYLTGYSIYNKLGLTTQVSNTIQIGRKEMRPAFKREYYTISFVNQKNTITKENIPLLQILDAIRYIKQIPDTTIESSCKRFVSIIASLSESEQKLLIKLSQKYPPATRALIGAIFDELKISDLSESIFRTLNPITKYKIPEVAQVLSTAAKWNIQ
ncbi:MAG: DUF6088 family protein [Bacteroidales bacterium]